VPSKKYNLEVMYRDYLWEKAFVTKIICIKQQTRKHLSIIFLHTINRILKRIRQHIYH